MKIFFLVLLFFFSCSKNNSLVETKIETKTEALSQEVLLPQKQNPKSMFMSESPITPKNIDDYLFLNDCIYVDLRTIENFYKEGHIAGFTNIPFYGYIAGFPNDDTSLFKMTRKDGVVLGSVGSFVSNYEESESVIFEMFSKQKNIIAISTAGVESCYFLNLLLQLGYDAEKLYNAGSFTNGMGNDIAYRTYSNAKHLVPGTELLDTKLAHTFSSLTKK